MTDNFLKFSMNFSSENGLSMFLWIGHSVDPKMIQDIFAVQSAAQVDIDKVSNSLIVFL